MFGKYKIPYVNMCIRLFAKHFQLPLQNAAVYFFSRFPKFSGF